MRSLIREINAAIALTLVIVSLFFAIGFVPYQKRAKEHSLEERVFLLKTFKKSEEGTLIDPLFERKSELLRLHLERLSHTRGILAIALYDKDGNALGFYPENFSPSDSVSREKFSEAEKNGEFHEEGSWRGDEALFFLAPLTAVDETLGYFQIVYSLTDIVQQQTLSWYFFALFLAALILTSTFLLNVRLSSLVTRPIKRLVSTVEQVEKGDFKSRAEMIRPDEIGYLSETVNNMILRLQKNFDEIQKQNEGLKELDRLRDEFIANVSHEIRTPIHIITGFTQELLEEIQDPDQAKILKS
ncbi:MAG: HAMP domain-containing protein, partial [bacterium]|nr:HAMP domain-containing protein [bacterium]